MGTLAVTLDQAVLFADSRYWEQAERELAGSGIDLVKIATGAATVYVDWLAQNLERGQTLSVDGQVLIEEEVGAAAAVDDRQAVLFELNEALAAALKAANNSSS